MQKLFVGGGGFESVTTPAPSKILIVHKLGEPCPCNFELST